MKKYLRYGGKAITIALLLLTIASCKLTGDETSPPPQGSGGPSQEEMQKLRDSLRVHDSNSAAEKPAADMQNKVAPVNAGAPVSPAMIIQEKQVKIAMLLPLSGANRKLGEAMLDAAQLAVSDLGKTNLALLPIDSGDDAATAINAINQAVQRHADIVLGPLFGPATAAVAPIARQAGISVISFSNEKNLGQGNVFLMGFAPEEQVDRVTKYALQKGLQEFSAYAPDDSYGHLVTDELKKDVQSASGTIGIAEFYKPSGDTRVDLSKAALITPENTQVAFIPEGGARLAEISEIIAKNSKEMGKIQFIGSGQWDDAATTSHPQLSGGWFAAAPVKSHADFDLRFAKIYHYSPSRLASLAYDAAALAGHLATSNGGNFTAQAITNPRGFVGTNGIFRFRADGVCQRGLAVLQVTPKGFQEIDPAPENFDGF